MKPEATDPRDRTLEADIRPVVAPRGRRTPPWLPVGAIALGSFALFFMLDAQRRDANTAPSTGARQADAVATVSSPTPLYIPPDFSVPPPPPPPSFPLVPAPQVVTASQPLATVAPLTPSPRPPVFQPPMIMQAPPAYAPQPPPPTYTPQQTFGPPSTIPTQQGATSSSAALVIDNTAGARDTGVGAADEGAATISAGVVRSGQLGRGAFIVPQGTLIPAVLETALDSTRPGGMRAVVSRDITGFSGGRVLIPRGSRLFGSYQADLAAGQNRALVEWTRLVRPDGVTIALNSPAADTQGRIGIQGRVDSHFLERFGRAVLQTTLNIGSSLAGQSLSRNGAVIVALPGSSQTTGASTSDTRIQPTLRVNAGARVTVLVAHDLQFSSGARR